MGKGVLKLEKVDDSIIYDRVQNEKVQMMLKKEVYPQLLGAPGPTKARAIQFCLNERTAYGLADESYSFSKALVEVSARPFQMGGINFLVRYTAAMNHADIGEFATESERLRSKFEHSVIDERDGKNWDANVQVEHRLEMVSVYTACDERLGALTAKGISVRGHSVYRKCDTVLFYKVQGTVKSGHWDTSCGNGALNIDISVQAILLLPPHLRPVAVRAMVMGDDYMAWLYFDHVVDGNQLQAALNAAEEALGIQPKRGLFKDVRNASFISLTFYLGVDGTVVALPKVGRMFCKLFWTVTPLQGRDPRALASGIAASFLPLYHSWPPMRQFLKYHTRVHPDGADNMMPFYNWVEAGLSRLPVPIDWPSNHLVKYGPLSLLIELEDLFRGEQGAALCFDSVVDSLYETDMADPDIRYGHL